MFPKTGPLWKKTPVSRALPNTSSRVTSKGALPPGSPHKGPIDTDAPFPDPSLFCPSKSLVNEPPLEVHQRGPYEERCLFPEPSVTYPSMSPVKQHPPPLQIPLTEHPWKEMLRVHPTNCIRHIAKPLICVTIFLIFQLTTSIYFPQYFFFSKHSQGMNEWRRFSGFGYTVC